MALSTYGRSSFSSNNGWESWPLEFEDLDDDENCENQRMNKIYHDMECDQWVGVMSLLAYWQVAHEAGWRKSSKLPLVEGLLVDEFDRRFPQD